MSVGTCVLLATVIKMLSLPACTHVLLLKEILFTNKKSDENFKGKFVSTLVQLRNVIATAVNVNPMKFGLLEGPKK